MLKNNGLLGNSGKSHFWGSLYEKIRLKILGSTVELSPCEDLLGITSDSELTFYKHIILSSKANQKLSDHRQTKNSPRKILLTSFITA